MRREHNQESKPTVRDDDQNHSLSFAPMIDTNTDGDGKMDYKMIDLNFRPQRIPGQASNNQVVVSTCPSWDSSLGKVLYFLSLFLLISTHTSRSVV